MDTEADSCLSRISDYDTVCAVAIETNVGADEYTKQLSKSTRQNLRTALNRMNKAGLNYRYTVIKGPLPVELSDELIALHGKRVVHKNADNSNLKKRISSFIRQRKVSYQEHNNNIVKDAMLSLDNSVTVIVYLNDKVAGYLYGVDDRGTIRIMHNCFDEEYAFYSPMFRGSYDFIIECCNNPDIKCVDFTRGKEEYKYKLGGKEMELHTYKIMCD